MKKDIAERWAEALRSGGYVQKAGVMKWRKVYPRSPPDWTHGHEHMHCCLGVLCELAIADGVDMDVAFVNAMEVSVMGVSRGLSDVGHFVFDGWAQKLPKKVMDWAGMKTNMGDMPNLLWPKAEHEDLDVERTLAMMNDQHYNFDEIADAIEANWRDL